MNQTSAEVDRQSANYRGRFFLRPNFIYIAILMSLVLIAAIRIAGTYHILSQVDDEGYHIACGMEWLDKGTYTYEMQHPPLTRVVAALGPYLLGGHSYGLDHPVKEGNAILNANGEYFRNLTAARLGNLMFLAIACAALAWWAWRKYGPLTAVLSVFLFTNVPPVLGHAGVATTDMGCTAAVILVLAVFVWWLDRPTRLRLLLFGGALGFAVLTKFSAPFFLVACIVPAIVLQGVTGRLPRPRLLDAFCAALLCFVVIWSGYRFHSTRWITRPGVQARLERMTGFKRELAEFGSRVPIPLSEVALGLRDVEDHNHNGHHTFLMGKYSEMGWWYYFPIVVLIKSPLSFLILAGIGFSILWLHAIRTRNWLFAAPALFAFLILASVLPSHIDIGIRHVLPLYGPLTLCGGYALARAASALRAGQWLTSAAVIALAVLMCAETATAHPDYLAWFNIAAGGHPENIVADSNIDWGQDLYRLSERLRDLKVQSVTMACLGNTDLSKLGLPTYQIAKPFQESTGWVAGSVAYLRLRRAKDGSYAWIARNHPTERVGKSIFLYYVPASGGNAALP